MCKIYLSTDPVSYTRYIVDIMHLIKIWSRSTVYIDFGSKTPVCLLLFFSIPSVFHKTVILTFTYVQKLAFLSKSPFRRW